VDQRITCSVWFPRCPEVCGDVWPSSQTSDGHPGRLEVAPAVWYNSQTSDSRWMANHRACAHPSPSLSTVSRQEGRRRRKTHLSDDWKIYQTSPSPSVYQPRRPILEIFPEQGTTRLPLATPPASHLARLLLRPQQSPLRVAPRPLRPPPAGPSSPGELALTAELRSRTQHLLRAHCGRRCRPRARAHAHWLKEKREETVETTGGSAWPFKAARGGERGRGRCLQPQRKRE
jgi:hypothetical protein